MFTSFATSDADLYWTSTPPAIYCNVLVNIKGDVAGK